MHSPLPFLTDIGLSGGDLRRLRERRDLIRIEAASLPQAVLRDLLAILEHARPWRTPPPPIAEMARPELLRAIRWRLGTIPPAGAEAGAAFVIRRRRRRRPGRETSR